MVKLLNMNGYYKSKKIGSYVLYKNTQLSNQNFSIFQTKIIKTQIKTRNKVKLKLFIILSITDITDQVLFNS